MRNAELHNAERNGPTRACDIVHFALCILHFDYLLS
jgi:hypothetical protein